MSKPFILRHVGSRWEVWIDTGGFGRFGNSKVRKVLADLPKDTRVPVAKSPEGLRLTPGGTPAKFETKGDAEHVIHMLGNYRFGLGSFVSTYYEVEKAERDGGGRPTLMREFLAANEDYQRGHDAPLGSKLHARAMRAKRRMDALRRRLRTSRDCIGVHTHDSRVSGRYLKSAARDGAHRHRTKGAPTFAQQRFIGKKIRRLHREGYEGKQAVAIAYRYAGVPKKKTKKRITRRRRTRR